MTEYLIVAGMSGAGRSSASATLEDLGWFVIDNLPVRLIGRVSELGSNQGSELDRLCFVVGRGRSDVHEEFLSAVEGLRASGSRVRVLFLDASDEMLVRRYEGTRRRHPLEAEGVLDSVKLERERFAPMRDAADIVLDTTDFNVHELHDRLVTLFASTDAASGMQTSVVSFGFKYGIPLDVDLVLDCRFLPNPHWIEELRPKTGLDPAVHDYVLSTEEAQVFLSKLDDLFEFLLPAYSKEGKSYLSIAIGCTGGHHRSVALAEELAAKMAKHGFTATVHHRDIDR